MAQTAQFCTFYLDKLLFGVELKGVQEVIRSLDMTKVPLAPPVVSGLINLRGQIVTAVDLRRRLELEPRPAGMRAMNVVVRSPKPTAGPGITSELPVIRPESGPTTPCRGCYR